MGVLRKTLVCLGKSTNVAHPPLSRLRRRMESVPLRIALTAALAIAGAARSVPELEAQSVNFGNVNVCVPGAIAPAPCSDSALVQITYKSGVSGTPAAPRALAEGAPSPDFSILGNDCTESTPPASGCLVNVKFSPQFAGLRAGAIQIPSTSGGILATTFVYGVGVGPQIAFGPGVESAVLLTPGSAEASPYGVTVDGAGNLFFVDRANKRVVKAPAGGGAQSTVIGGLNAPFGLAIDGAGDLFIADEGNDDVVKVPAGGGATSHLGSGLISPTGLAVDGAGNVYVADTANHRVVELPSAGGQITVASGVTPLGLAVNAAGDLFIGETGGIVEVVGGKVVTVITGLNTVYGLAVDGAGDLFIADYVNNRIVELPSGGEELIPVAAGVSHPIGVAVDEAGNLFTGESDMAVLLEVQRSQPPALGFATTNVGSTSSDSPKSVEIQSIGNQLLTVTDLTVSPNFDRVNAGGTPEECATAFSLAPGAQCNLSTSFEPTEAGSLAGAATLTDNALNATGATQTIDLSGTGTLVSQTITFNTIPAQVVGASLNLAAYASASSDLPVSFVSASASVCSVSGTTATMLTAGNCVLEAMQSGNAMYSAAKPVTQQFAVRGDAQTITFAPSVTTYPFTAGSFTVNATASSSLPVSFASLTPGTCTVSGSAVTIVSAGICGVQASQAGNGSYAAATPVTVNFTISQATPTITWSAPAAITYGTALTATQLNAAASVPGSFTYTPSAGTVLGAGQKTLGVTFTPTDKTDYTTATASVTLTVNQATPTLSWATPAAITYGTALTALQLDASSTVAGTFAYTPAVGTTLGAGAQALKATFTPKDTTDYTTATASVTLTVNPAPQTILFNGLPATAIYGAGPFTLGATASSGLPISYSVSGPGSVSGSTLTITGAGMVAVTASQPGNANYAPAAPVTLNISVAPVSSAITIASSASSSTYGGSITLTATVTSTVGTPSGAVNFTNGGVVFGMALLNASGIASLTTTALPVGNDMIGASYSATQNYGASTSPVIALTVNAAASTTALTVSSSSIVFGGGVTLTATVTSAAGTPAGMVTFSNGAAAIGTGTLNSSGVATLTNNSLPLGTAALIASYSGGGDFAPSSSTPIGLLVSQIPTTTTLVSSSPTAAVSATVVFTATVAAPAGDIVPTGMVSFSDGGTPLSSSSVDGNGAATYSTTSLAAGTHVIIASYAGDTAHATSTSTPLIQTISAPTPPSGPSGFTITSSTDALTITQGQTGTATFTFTAVNGFNQPVTLTCSGLPVDSTCIFAPASVTPTTSGATSTLSITTNVSSASADQRVNPSGKPGSTRTLTSLAGISLGSLILLLGVADRRQFGRLSRMGTFLLAFTIGGALVSLSLGCGGGGGPKTPVGLSQVNITATGSSNGATISQTIQLYVTITK